MSKEKSRIINLIIDIVCVVLCVVLLFVAISTLTSKGKGYVAYFGRVNMGIETDSMWPYAKVEGGYSTEISDGAVLYEKGNDEGFLPSFKSGDLVKCNELNDEEKQELEVGDIVAYKGSVAAENKPNQISLITHRIISINTLADGTITSVVTKGDGETNNTGKTVTLSSVVAKVTKVVPGAGAFSLWTKTSGGFFVCIVLPSILIVGYFLVMLIISLSKRDTAKEQVNKEELEAQVRAELEAKLRAEMGLTPATEAPVEQQPTQQEQQPTTPPEE